MTQLEIETAKKILFNFKKLREEFNNKYYELDFSIAEDDDLKIKNDYFTYEDVIQLQEVIIDYKKIINK